MTLLFRVLLAGQLLAGPAALAQVGVGTTSPNAKAALDVSATDKGLLIPRLTEAQRTAIATPPDGLMVFQTNNASGFWYAFGGSWVRIPTAGDNLGNHTATQNLRLNNNWLSNDGDNEGLRIDNNGNVSLGTAATLGRRLTVTAANATLAIGAAGTYNQVDSGRLQFQEDVESGVDCGFQFVHNGLTNNLYLVTGCPTPDTTLTLVRNFNNPNTLGGVGIGVRNPLAKLHTAGSVRHNVLAGVGTRMVVVDANGTLSTRPLPAGTSPRWTGGPAEDVSRNSSAGSRLPDADAIGQNARARQGRAVSVGSGPDVPSSTPQVNGTFAVGVVSNLSGGRAGGPNDLDQGSNGTPSIGGYYGLAPTSGGAQHYRLPAASVCPGRIYHLRNTSSRTSAILSSAGGQLFDGTSRSGLSAFMLRSAGPSKTITAISDGANWTIIKSGN